MRLFAYSDPTTLAADGPLVPMRGPGVSTQDRIAVLELSGPLVSSPLSVAGTSWAEIESELNSLARNEAFTGVLVKIDSGGGEVKGLEPARRALQRLAMRKPVYTFVSGACASAAYWLASASTRVYGERLSAVGSLGAYAVVHDTSALAERAGLKVIVVRSGSLKGAFEPGTEIADEHLAMLQSVIDTTAAALLDDVAQGRKIDRQFVGEQLSSGRVWQGAEALQLRLLDAVAPIEQCLRDLQDHARLVREAAGLERPKAPTRNSSSSTPAVAAALSKPVDQMTDSELMTWASTQSDQAIVYAWNRLSSPGFKTAKPSERLAKEAAARAAYPQFAALAARRSMVILS